MSTTVTTKAEKIAGVKLQQSSLGFPLAVGYGRSRWSSNLLWYGDFKSVAVTTTTSSGKGGVKQKNTTYEYYVAFQAAFGEGIAIAVPTTWVGKSKFVGGTTYSGSNTITELVTVSYSGKVKMGAYSRLTSVTTVVLCQGPYDTADVTLTAGVHYTVVGGVILVDVATYPQYKGRILRVTYVYSQTGLISSLTKAGFPFFANGGVGQAPYSFMTSNHPTEALGYSETALVSANSYRLDDSAQLPNHNFEIISRLQYPAKDDCDPADVVLDILTHPTTGANFSGRFVYDLELYSTYCRANGLFISPNYTDAREAREVINEILDATNCAAIWSEGYLKIIPYGDEAATGNGATYTPNLTPIYDLTDDDFIVTGKEDPVKFKSRTPADSFNSVQIEILNRLKDYNVEPITRDDQASIEAYGLKKADPIAWHMYCDIAIGTKAAQLYLQRKLYVRSEYMFKLSWKYCLLEPMDIVTITDEGLGFDKTPMRIVSIRESADGLLDVTVEDFPSGVASATLYPTQDSTGYMPDYTVDPGNVAVPSLFEPPIELTANGLEVWAAVSGVGPNWGGCTVYVSLDGTTYKRLGSITGGARYGTITGDIAAGASVVAPVALVGLGGQFVSGTASESANKATLSLIGDEFLGYTTAVLTGAQAYDLTLANRGFYASGDVSHSSGARFVRVDDRIVKSDPLDYSLIGSTIHFKFTSFNLYGSAEQSLVDVADYTYTIRGNMLALPPSNVTGATYALEGFGVRLKWNTIADQDLSMYEIRVGGTDWASATPIAQSKSNSYLWAVQIAGTYTVRIRALDQFGNYSVADDTVSVVIAAPTATSPSATLVGEDVVLTWGVTTGAFNIDRYEIRTGASWDAGTFVATALTTNFKEKAVWVGNKNYWVAAIDVAGNFSAAVSVSVNIVAPSNVIPTAEVIDNNILLRWADATTSLPIQVYEIRKGSTFAGGTTVGFVGQGRFTALFEQVGGVFTYWVRATDTAGNTNTAQAISVLVNQPPDYILQLDFNSTFSGTKSNCLVDNGILYAILDPTQTYSQHFTVNSWSTPQDQVTAGYPLYFQPSATSGYYEETIDYGTTLPATGVAATITYTTVTGTVTITPQISVKLNIGDAWTDYAGQSQIVASNFRYIKVRYDFASAGGDDLIAITSINIKLSSKQRTDQGIGSAVSSDSGGTTVNFNVDFIDVSTIEITPKSTTAVIATYDFTDVPNPTSFKVLLFNTSGTRISGDFSWTVRGI